MKGMNYDVNPDALKTIESKMRQMQATGANITPEMMQAIYSSVLEVGAEKAQERGKIEAESKIRSYGIASANERFDKALDAKQSEGLGNAIGNTLLYGGKYAKKKGYLDEFNLFGKPKNGQGTTPELGVSSTLSPDIVQPQGTGEVLPGPVTTPPPATSELFTGVPKELLGNTGNVPGIAGAGVLNPVPEVAEMTGETITELTPEVIEGAGKAGLEAGTDAATGIAEGTSSSMLGPAGAGAFGAGLLKMAGVRDDVGKAILFGEGGKNEQDIAGGVGGGAAAGAVAGTYIFPGVGTVVGGILGGIAGGVSSAFDDLF